MVAFDRRGGLTTAAVVSVEEMRGPKASLAVNGFWPAANEGMATTASSAVPILAVQPPDIGSM
jgi:hypothetical protein